MRAQFLLWATLFLFTNGVAPAQEKAGPAPHPATSTLAGGSPRNSLADLSDSVERLVRRLSPAVVQIVTESFVGRDDGQNGNASIVTRETGVGTGFLVSADGDVITNAHVVAGARRVRVRLRDTGAGAGRRGTPGRLIEAQVAGVDRETDLALLKLPGVWPHLQLADSRLLRQGQIVLALGNPRGLEDSVTMGVVSATNRQIHPDAAQAYIQTDAPINPGNSGGPLVNTNGAVVGVNTFIITESGGSEGLGFAIPSGLVRDVYAQLRKYGRVRRGELGVIIRSVTPAIASALGLSREEGVLVQDVRPGGGAAEAGLHGDDIVTRVQGRPVRNVRQFSNSLFRSEIGGRLTLEVVRGEQTIQLQVPLEESTDPGEAIEEKVKDKAVPVPQLGILAIPLDATTAALIPQPRYRFGSIVVARFQSSSSFQEELEPGDIVYRVNGKTADTVELLRELSDKLPEANPLVVQVQRDGILRYLVLRGE